MATDTTGIAGKNKQQEARSFGADEGTTTTPPPELPHSSRQRSIHNHSETKKAEEKKNQVEISAVQHQILRGHPVTISQCKFQAHIARICTQAEAKAVSEAVSAETAREAGLSGFVCPFAFRLGFVQENSGGDRMDEEEDTASEARGGINGEDEGYCDNGDVGVGEKLLCLLQKWDIRHRFLAVTRIDGGFMMAELLGVRRYKFVVDRAKRLLDNSDLASLRRAVDTDINQATVAVAKPNGAIHEAAAAGGARNNRRHAHGASGVGRARVDGRTGEDRWDTFVVPLSVQGTIPGHTEDGGAIGIPRASGGGRTVLPHTASKGSSLCGIGPKSGTEVLGLTSSRAREQRALSLAQLSIRSQTVDFAPGHVPCSMGDKGHGKKRGRINHFAVRTPPSTSRDGDSFTCDPDKDDSVGSTGAPCRQITTSPRWHLPHELDPTSATTSLREDGPAGGDGRSTRRSGGNRARGASNVSLDPFHDASTDVLDSRASSCATINSPGRISTIMMGMFSGLSNDHSLHPPPPTMAGYGGKQHHFHTGVNCSGSSSTMIPYSFAKNSAGCTSDGGSYSGFGAPSCDSSEVSSARGAGGRRCYNKTTLSGATSGTARNEWGGLPPHRPGENTAGMTAATSHANTALSVTNNGLAATIPNDDCASDCIHHPSAIGRTSSGNGRGGGDHNSNGGIPLPLLRRTPAVRVREKEASLVQDGDGGGLATVPCTRLGSSSPSVGGWQDDGDGSISTAGESLLHTLSIEQLPPTPQAPSGDLGPTSAGEKERCDSSGIWSLGYPTPRAGVISGEVSSPRAKSALRGWSVGSAVPASQPDCDGLAN